MPCNIAIIRLFFKHTLLRFLLKTLNTWYNAFLFTDYLFKREICVQMCESVQICGVNESTVHIIQQSTMAQLTRYE